MNRKIRTTTFTLATLLLVLASAGAAYGQRDPSDRPGPRESRSVRSREIIDRDKTATTENPAEAMTREANKQVVTTDASKRSRARAAFSTTAAIPAGGDPLAAAVETALKDYKEYFAPKFDPKADPSYGNSHTKLRSKDYARAYVMALDPRVAAKFDGRALAETRAQATTYDSYEDILEKEVGLSRDESKRLAKSAKAAVDELVKTP
jgi:hypothetical protein